MECAIRVPISPTDLPPVNAGRANLIENANVLTLTLWFLVSILVCGRQEAVDRWPGSLRVSAERESTEYVGRIKY